MIFLRKRLRRASFRGVWFFLSGTETETGRRVARFEFPYQDQPIVEDLGKQGQVICISGFVSGANYRSDTDRLIQQCELPGAGELFHPYYGRRQVVCRSCRVSENNVEGGIVYFSLQFLETKETGAIQIGLQNFPLTGVVVGAELLAAASQLVTDTINQANDQVGALDQVVDSVLMGIEFLETCFSPLMHVSDTAENLALALSDLKRTVRKDFTGTTSGLIQSFQSLIRVIAGASLDDVDPYHWTKTFPPEKRWNFDPVTSPILIGMRGIIAGTQATSVFTKLPKLTDKDQLLELKHLKANLDTTLIAADSVPSVFQKIKSLKTITISELFKMANANPDLKREDGHPKKCLLLEAYEERGGLNAIPSISHHYKDRHTCFPI